MLKIETKETKHVIEYMGAKFTVVPVTKQRHEEIIKDNTFVHKIETGDRQEDRYEEKVNLTGILVDKMVAQIVAWEGIADNLECTTEAKTALASRKENEHICLHIQKEIEALGKANEKKKAKIKKT